MTTIAFETNGGTKAQAQHHVVGIPGQGEPAPIERILGIQPANQGRDSVQVRILALLSLLNAL